MRSMADGLAARRSLGEPRAGNTHGKYGADVHFGPDDRRSRPIYDNFQGEKLTKTCAS
jgi:hypothetical protein